MLIGLTSGSVPLPAPPPVPMAAAAAKPRIDSSWGSVRVSKRRKFRDANERMIRFRFVGTGPASKKQIIADTHRAQQLLNSPAGPRLVAALRSAAAAVLDAHQGNENMHSIALVPDKSSAAVAGLYALADSGKLPALKTKKEKAEYAQSYYDYFHKNPPGAYNSDGAIVLMPEMSRALLASVGSYDPTFKEVAGYAPKDIRKWTGLTLLHEMEHSVSPGSDKQYARLAWLEEGTAEVLSQAQPAVQRYKEPTHARNRYGKVDDRSERAARDWRPYPVMKQKAAKKAAKSNKVYERRQNAVAELLALAGINANSAAGYPRARKVLQGRELAKVPADLAGAIASHQRISTKQRDRLALRIRNFERNGNDTVGKIARDFKLTRK